MSVAEILSRENLGSVVLENKGSVARDHLANERTFLSWSRTSLAFASIGVAVTQLFRLMAATDENSILDHETLRKLGRPIGGTFVGGSILMLLMGSYRFFRTQYMLQHGKFPAARSSILILLLLALGLVLSTFGIILGLSK